MKRFHLTCLALVACAFPATAYCEPGEFWEDTIKMVMPNSPAPGQPQVRKVCRPTHFKDMSDKEMANIIQQGIQKKQACHDISVKRDGNKSLWEASCRDGGAAGPMMKMQGELVKSASTYSAKVHVSLDGGQAKGPQEMTLTIDSKLIGGSCDAKKMQAKQPG